MVKAISGQSTIRYKKELERNITIKLGYSNAKIYKADDVPRPDCYISSGSSDPDVVCSYTKNVDQDSKYWSKIEILARKC